MHITNQLQIRLPGVPTTDGLAKNVGFGCGLNLLLMPDLSVCPNAGKSTFLSAVTRARPKIADYPFTTLHPNLGVGYVDGDEIILADVPGLIEGAHEGAGLGDRFLGHIERCGVLLHLIDGTHDDPAKAYRTVRNELRDYGAALDQKNELVALNKCDALKDELIHDAKFALEKESGKPVATISGIAGTGLSQMLRKLKTEADAWRAREVAKEVEKNATQVEERRYDWQSQPEADRCCQADRYQNWFYPPGRWQKWAASSGLVGSAGQRHCRMACPRPGNNSCILGCSRAWSPISGLKTG